jgi:hypothetical protein
VKYELGFYIPEDAIRHSHRRENLKSNQMQIVRMKRLISLLKAKHEIKGFVRVT